MLKYSAVLILIIPLLADCKSSKKGVCIPPGDRFHCGDLAAFRIEMSLKSKLKLMNALA